MNSIDSASMYWWCRFDGQTELQNGESLFNREEIIEWLQHEAVLQGGELTAWPNYYMAMMKC